MIDALMAKARELRIAVIGDLMLDETIEGQANRISPEAPILILNKENRRVMPGGAANVAVGIAKLGAHCTVIGLIGNDGSGHELKDLLHAKLVDARLIEDAQRPTTTKTRCWSKGHGQLQQLLRIDIEMKSPAEGTVKKELLRHIEALRSPDGSKYDAVVVSDYAKGVLSEDIMRAIVGLEIPVFIAPKPVNWKLIHGASVIVPNYGEAHSITSSIRCEHADAPNIAKALQKEFSGKITPQVIVTQGKDGIVGLDSDGTLYHSPARAREVFDVTGAGDTVLAVLAVGLTGGLTLHEAMHIANVAAGIKVGEHGVATISFEQIEKALVGSNSINY